MAGAVAAGSAQQSLLGFASRSRSATNADMQQRAQSEAERAQGGAVTGGGTSRAVALQAGGSAEISNLEGANGTWFLTEVTHQWTPREYENRFVATPWKQWRSPRPPRAGTAPGVQVARVVSNIDPEQRGRLVVSLFWQEDTLLLAPMSTLHSGAGFGFAVLPEVGDEVLVAFQDADPERPVILGSLWNGKHTPPRDQFLTADEQQNNLVKRFVTKSGIRIHMTDTPGKESIVLATPSSNVLQLTEHAEETGRPAIHLHSAGDILIRAAGRIHTHAQFHSAHIDGKVMHSVRVKMTDWWGNTTHYENLTLNAELSSGETKQVPHAAGQHFTGIPQGQNKFTFPDFFQSVDIPETDV